MRTFLLILLQIPEPKLNPFEQYGPFGIAALAIIALFAVVKIVLNNKAETEQAILKTLEALKTIVEERLPRRRK